MNYTNDKDQIVFLRDADIANSLDGKTISSTNITTNGIPSFDLFKQKYNELSTYDDNLCTYIKDQVEVSVATLDNQKTIISAAVDFLSDFLSDTISVDLYTLSSGVKETSTLLSDQVIALWNDVKGGVNYKGHLYGFEGKKINNENLALSDIFALKYNLYNTETWQLSSNKSFNNGWLYNVTLTGDYITNGYITKDGISIENNDYFIIHNKDLSCVDVSCIDRATIDIIEAVQDDYVRFALLENISTTLSSDYFNKIDTLDKDLQDQISLNDKDIEFLSSEISSNDNDIEFLSLEISSNDNDIEYISAEISSNDNDIEYISAEISSNDNDIEYISAEISSNDNDIEFLSSEISSNDNDIEFLSNQLSVEVERNLDSAHYKLDMSINAEDHTIRSTLKRTFGNTYDFRIGYIVRFPQEHTITNEDSSWKYTFEENDFIIFKKNCTIEDVDETCFDIIKDYDKENIRNYTDLTTQLNSTSSIITSDVKYLSTFLSDTISVDLYKLSNELCEVSTNICLSSDGISVIVDNLSSDLSNKIDKLELSTNEISNVVKTNTKDIANIQDYISGDNGLCAKLSDVTYHYNRTFIEQAYTKGGTDLSVDVLKVVDQNDLTNKYVLIYLSGTLALSAM